ncbi:MAG TPA: PaaI family thioesterase [Dehalococcoidia bacterium]|nr:PaaI family thioesterase [Dehalococcoidia bacterium]
MSDSERDLANESLARWCYACGDLNPIGLHLEFRVEDDWAVASFVASREHQGYPGFVHGGVVSALLDEAMGWATYGRGVWAVTGRMSTRFRGAVPVGEPLEVRGRIKRDRGRTLEVMAELRDHSGALLAAAEGLFFRLQGEQARRMAQAVAALMKPSP